MKAVIIILCMFLTAIAGCSENAVVTPDDDNQPNPVIVLDISYETDDARSSSGLVTPASGGAVQATSADGVVFDLAVYPGAVDSDVTIRITPFAYLSIAEIGAAADTVCVHGAYFEPDGLEFDTTAVLTVTFPQQGFDCEFDDIAIVSVDSTESLYEILPTAFDAGANALACTLTHFSGWGTHGPDEDLLRRLINSAIAYGNSAPSDEYVRLLATYRQWALAKGWNDLADLAWDGAWAVFGKLVESAISGRDIDEMVRRMQQAQGWGWPDYETALAEAIDSEVRALAAQGRNKCALGQRAEGRSLMFRALEYAQRGLVEDPAWPGQVKRWLADCGAVKVELTADKALIYDLARSEGDDRTFVTFEIRVTDMDGDPVENVTPSLWWDLPSSGLSSASSRVSEVAPVEAPPADDEPGVTRRRFVYRASYPPIPEGRAVFWGVVQTGGEEIRSEPVAVTLRRARFALNLTFSYEEEWTNEPDIGGGSLLAMCTASGDQTIHGNANCAFLSRSYSQVWTGPGEGDSGTCAGSDDPKLPACNMYGATYRHGKYNDEFQTAIDIVDRAAVGVSYPFNWMWTTCSWSSGSGGGSSADWLVLWDRFACKWAIADELDWLYWDGNQFPPISIVKTEPLQIRHGTWSVILSATVAVD